MGISSLLKSGRNEDRKLTIPQNALVCFNVLGESKFLIASHLPLRGVQQTHIYYLFLKELALVW